MVKIKYDGKFVVSGSFNLGYIGTFTDEMLAINVNVMDWEALPETVNTPENAADFLTRYFNQFEKKIQNNIKHVNDAFLAHVFDSTALDRYDVEEPGYDMDDYSYAPNDGSIKREDVEKVLRKLLKGVINIDELISQIRPESLILTDGTVAFQISDENQEFLCGAYGEIWEEDLSITDWNNF